MAEFDFEKQLTVTETGIPVLKVVELSVHGDNRGWFKENWQREKMVAAGIPDLRFVQNNISFNDNRGVTRGIHAEPWDKFISVATGSVFGAWVDLRPGAGFGGNTNIVSLVTRDSAEELPIMPKSGVADAILDRVARLMERA